MGNQTINQFRLGKLPPRPLGRGGLVVLLTLMFLGVIVVSCRARSVNRPTEEADVVKPTLKGPPAAILLAERHPDTIDTVGPYEVQLLQIAGAKITDGEVHFSIENSQGEFIQREQNSLQLSTETNSWKATIPGAPTGAQITYFFRVQVANGQTVRYPANEDANFRFRIIPLEVVTHHFPDPLNGQEEQALSLEVRALGISSGAVVIRNLTTSLESLQEERISLQVTSEAQNTYKLAGMFPALKPGQIVDFYFHLVTENGTEQNIPVDAPSRMYSIKRPLTPIDYFPTEDAFVLDVSASGQDRWIGLNHGGAWHHRVDGEQDHWSFGQGMPSGTARFVLPDATSGRVYIGSDRGVGFIEAGKVFINLTNIHASALDGQSTPNPLMQIHRAGPGVLSPLDGTLFFQLQGETQLEQSYPPVIFFEFRDDKLNEWHPPSLNPPLVAMSTGSFDLYSGCLLFGAFTNTGQNKLSPTFLTRCGPNVEQTLLKNFTVDKREAKPTRVISVARDPNSGAMVAAIEYLFLTDPNQTPKYGIFVVDQESGTLSALAKELSALDTEITALAADWGSARLLVGTFGQGIWQIISGNVTHLDLEESLPNEITSLEVDAINGAILIGTSTGAYELSIKGHLSDLYTAQINDTLPNDALPMDVNKQDGRVLISSYLGGLAEITRQSEGLPIKIIRLRPGKELPTGLFGNARYASDGEILAIMHSQGLLKIDNGETSIIGPKEGLFSSDLLHLLALSSGKVWLAFTPQPFGPNPGAALQLLADSKVEQTVELKDRDAATIGNWIEVPQRGTVFAATRAGVFEISLDGSVQRLSVNPVSTIAKNSEGSVVGIAGTTIERWDGNHFVPVLFQVDHPRWPHGKFYLPAPIDLAINEQGQWFLLFKDGILVLLDSEGLPLGIMDTEDGIPASSRKILVNPGNGDLFIGGNEGLVMISPIDLP